MTATLSGTWTLFGNSAGSCSAGARVGQSLPFLGVAAGAATVAGSVLTGESTLAAVSDGHADTAAMMALATGMTAASSGAAVASDSIVALAVALQPQPLSPDVTAGLSVTLSVAGDSTSAAAAEAVISGSWNAPVDGTSDGGSSITANLELNIPPPVAMSADFSSSLTIA